MARIKICGLSRLEDVEVVNEILPEYAGFIINYPKSIRSLNPLQVKELCCHLDKKVRAVGVFVDSPIELPLRMLREGTIDLAQLHGREDDAYIRKLMEKAKRPVIKAFSVSKEEDIDRVMSCP
ncbi:MAG: phosphoribosylanthranilate isomerase, partial [Blautia sp.]|nr:phosphoribosylanthranilate isomerase [Blautia sp.]